MTRNGWVQNSWFHVVMAIVIIVISYYGWKFERWANWKLSYGSKVSEQIQVLEKRVKSLEDRNAQ